MMIKHQQIAKLETQLETVIEGTFATLFGSQIQTHDIALRLARAMEDAALPPRNSDARPIAPDHYLIILNPDVQKALINRSPTLTAILADHLVELATQSGYHLSDRPCVTFVGDTLFSRNQFNVQASHRQATKDSSTAAMQPIRIPKPSETPLKAHLIINNHHIEPLELAVLNVGRHKDNHIIINDSTVSRHHAQIRRRFDEHILFNAQSKSGTFVNGVLIREHRLKSGDVIRIGNTQMVYLIEGDHRDLDETVEDGTRPMPPTE